jgi:hypothetical protein
MKNKIINTFALIGVITVIAVACSSALSEDDDVIVATNNGVNSTTNTGSTNTSVQSTNGRYAISCTGNGANGAVYCYIMDTRDGNIVQSSRM